MLPVLAAVHGRPLRGFRVALHLWSDPDCDRPCAFERRDDHSIQVLASPLERGMTQTDPYSFDFSDHHARHVLIDPINLVADRLDRRMRASPTVSPPLRVDDRGLQDADGLA